MKAYLDLLRDLPNAPTQTRGRWADRAFELDLDLTVSSDLAVGDDICPHRGRNRQTVTRQGAGRRRHHPRRSRDDAV